MGKKKLRSKYTSNGERNNNDPMISKAIRREFVGSVDQLLAKQKAFSKGKKVMLTIENPNPKETAKRFIRVPASEVWGDYRAYNAYTPIK